MRSCTYSKVALLYYMTCIYAYIYMVYMYTMYVYYIVCICVIYIATVVIFTLGFRTTCSGKFVALSFPF